MLADLLSELNSTFQVVLREKLYTVEVIKSILAVKPTSYISFMLQGMANHLVELITRMAVLCCCITDCNSFSRFSHRADVNSESVRVGLTEGPNFISNICDITLLGRVVLI